MRKATEAVAMWLGIVAGIGGLEHGYFEILQRNTRPDNLAFFTSIGPPCNPDVAWNACEPTMTVLPNLLITGILALIFGLAVLVWSARYIQSRHGGLVLILLSVGMLLFGGGAFLSIGNVKYEMVKLVHNIAPVIAVLAMFQILGKVVLFSLLPNGKSAKYYSTGYSQIGWKIFLEDWATLFKLLEEGKIKPVIQEKFPILEARKANELLESGKVTGNVVLLSPELL